MSEFVIACPHCGKYARAKTGFFAKKRIDCDCGYTIDVRTDSLTSRLCPHCGNQIVFDQREGAEALCPVCRKPVNEMDTQVLTAEITCAQCGVHLTVSKAAAEYTCPVCDCVNDVQKRIGQAEYRRQGFASVIKYEGGSDTIVWKHPVEDFNCGSQLIVHESQEAIFFRDGAALDCFGGGRYTLETSKLPILEKLYQLPTDPDATFHSEVYFINMATQMGIKWGTDTKVRLFDPASGLHIELGASGEFNIRVTDSRKLLMKLVGTTAQLGQEQILGSANSKGYFRGLVMTQVKSHLAQVIRENAISVLEIDERLMELSDALKGKINTRLAEYGLEIPDFFVSRVVTPDDDPNYRRLKEQFAEQYLSVRQEQIRKSVAEAEARRKAVEAQTAAQMKIIGAQGEAEALKIQKAAEAEAYRLQAQAEAEEMRMKGYTYQQETARQVGLAATEAMSQMGSGDGGSAASASLGGIGQLAQLGITLGTVGGVIGMTKDAISPMMSVGKELGQSMSSAISGAATQPEPVPAEVSKAADTWDCSCGCKSIASKFCPDCGAKRPEAPKPWDCPRCGFQGILSRFCPECGSKKPEPPQPWDCACGRKGITSGFCPDCGSKKPE